MNNSNNVTKTNTTYQPPRPRFLTSENLEPKPSFLTSENPEVVNNLDMNISGLNLSDPSNYQSIDDSQNNNVNYHPSHTSTYTANKTPINYIQKSYTEKSTSVYNHNYIENSGPQAFTFDKNLNQFIQQPSKKPVQTEVHVIHEKVREKKESFISKIVRRILSFIGCMLFILSVIVLTFIYAINF